MRFIIKPTEHQTAKLKSQATYLELLNIARNKLKNRIKDSIYRDSYSTAEEKRSKVEDQLALSYFNKCGYCERLCKADVEHYRPKKGVDDDGNHEGYYWLCYEWTNLLPACVKCNRDGGKHNQFPILGQRVNNPSFLPDNNLDLDKNKANNTPLREESPYLLHPEVDNPSDYFEFELDPNGDGIRIKGNDDIGRGESTISICSLNRQELRLERVENVINQFKMSIESAFVMFDEEDSFTEDDLINSIELQLFALINFSNNKESTHTLLRKYIVESSGNFEKIVLPFLSTGIRNIVMAAYNSIVNN
ncbi:hypothetical protein [Flagellimonas sp. S3867]|uniref:hypothetical protein n=1 Tax=Flagellimonas sp. S3867 TaxID=2768063 RepID=UPI0016873D2A|nr:hypothetical protein [Flagellimonas sp. S3867]